MKKQKTVQIVQFAPAAANPELNAKRMISIIEAAKKNNVGLVVFPNRSVTGYGVFINSVSDDFVDDCDHVVEEITEASNGIVVAFSSFVHDDDGNISIWHIVAEDGKLLSFGELFDSPCTVDSATMGKFVIMNSDALYDEELELQKGVKFALFQYSGTFSRDSYFELEDNLLNFAATHKVPMFYANPVAVSDEDKCLRAAIGLSGIFSSRGKRIAMAQPLEECTITMAPDECGSKCQKREVLIPENDVALFAETIRFILRKTLEHLKIKRVVLGVSGGIDSAVASALYASVLPADDILLVSMPGPFTSQTTRNLGHELANNLGARYAEIPIRESVELTSRQFEELVTEGPHGAMAGAWSLSSFALENVQARDRGTRVLAAAAAAFGGVVSCNANKTECTIGYGTLYGDITGWLCCLGDLWKGDVYALGRYLNDEVFDKPVIPEGIFTIKPSAELSEKQAVDKGLGDPLVYEYHDKLFQAWVEGGITPEKCLEWYADSNLGELIGYDGDINKIFPSAADFIADIERWWNLYRGLATAKRLQAPPSIVISGYPLAEDNASQTGPYYSRRYHELKADLLK